MTRKWSPVTEKYLGQPIGDGQNPDRPGDGVVSPEGARIAGRGAVSGGSKPTPQKGIMKSGSGALHGSYPRQTQKIRG